MRARHRTRRIAAFAAAFALASLHAEASPQGATPAGQLLDRVTLPITIITTPPPLPPREIAAPPAPQQRLIWMSRTYARGDHHLLSVVAAGDVMMGTNYPSRAELNPAITPDVDAAALLGSGLASVFRAADLAFVNLEGTLFDGSDRTAKSCRNCFAFRSPEFYAGVLASLGIDVVSLANNHSGDFGVPGRKATVAALARAGIGAAGLRDHARTASLTARDGRKVAVAAFAPNIGTLDIHNLAAAAALVRELKETHDIVLVSFHGGAEGWDRTRVPKRAEIYLGENRGAVEQFAHRVVDAGASLVIGHGPHVPRAVEIYRGRLIAYSLGNFWTHNQMMNYAVSGLGPVLQAWLAPDGSVAGFEIHSTRQAGLGLPYLDPLGEAARYVFYLTKLDYPATAARFAAPFAPTTEAGRPSARPAPVAAAPAPLAGAAGGARGAAFSAPKRLPIDSAMRRVRLLVAAVALRPGAAAGARALAALAPGFGRERTIA
jgi:hypothetical protein